MAGLVNTRGSLQEVGGMGVRRYGFIKPSDRQASQATVQLGGV